MRIALVQSTNRYAEDEIITDSETETSLHTSIDVLTNPVWVEELISAQVQATLNGIVITKSTPEAGSAPATPTPNVPISEPAVQAGE